MLVTYSPDSSIDSKKPSSASSMPRAEASAPVLLEGTAAVASTTMSYSFSGLSSPVSVFSNETFSAAPEGLTLAGLPRVKRTPLSRALS